VLAGVRWSPFTARPASLQIKPFVAASVGPVFGEGTETIEVVNSFSSDLFKAATVGGDVLGGVDFHLARPLSVGVSGGYNWMRDFSRPFGASVNHSGAEFRISLGFLFGKGR
jgi:hypothetical protein